MESQNTKVLKMNNFFLGKKRYISVNELNVVYERSSRGWLIPYMLK